MVTDGFFFISSALNVKQLSVFNNDERFLQTVDTIRSIDKYCPNSIKYIFDTSYEPVNPEYVYALEKMGATFHYCGENKDVRTLSDHGQRSLAETLGFIIALGAVKNSGIKAKRFYKMSGRYKLNENFVADREDFKDSFVFLPTVNSWMTESHQNFAGVSKIFELRLWHMDASLFDTFNKEIFEIFEQMQKYHIDVEHAYYKVLNKYKWTTIDPIGLEGVIAPTGEIINE